MGGGAPGCLQQGGQLESRKTSKLALDLLEINSKEGGPNQYGPTALEFIFEVHVNRMRGFTLTGDSESDATTGDLFEGENEP